MKGGVCSAAFEGAIYTDTILRVSQAFLKSYLSKPKLITPCTPKRCFDSRRTLFGAITRVSFGRSTASGYTVR